MANEERRGSSRRTSTATVLKGFQGVFLIIIGAVVWLVFTVVREAFVAWLAGDSYTLSWLDTGQAIAVIGGLATVAVALVGAYIGLRESSKARVEAATAAPEAAAAEAEEGVQREEPNDTLGYPPVVAGISSFLLNPPRASVTARRAAAAADQANAAAIRALQAVESQRSAELETAKEAMATAQRALEGARRAAEIEAARTAAELEAAQRAMEEAQQIVEQAEGEIGSN